MPRTRPRTVTVPPALLAWPVAVLALALSLTALVLHSLTADGLRGTTDLYLTDLWLGVLGPTVGAAVVARERAAGLVLLGTAPIALGTAGGAYAVWAADTGGAPGAAAAAWLATWTWVPFFAPVLLLPVVLRPSRVARATAPVLGVLLLVAVLCAFAPGPAGPFAGVPNPLGVAGAPWLVTAAGAVIAVTAVVLVPGAAGLAVLRWYRATGDDRTQLGLLAIGALAFAAAHLSPVSAEPLSSLLVAVGATVLLGSVALGVHLRAVTAGLRRERELLATAREVERLRLHRDLHDGVGPELAGLTLQLGAVASASDEPALHELEGRLRGVVGEVRRVVDDLRPAGLDASGLAGALGERARMFSVGGLTCTVDAEVPPGLHPAVEVAAYRIAVEALTNVARHSGAARCTVRLRPERASLVVEVVDDGAGLGEDVVVGVGLPSMRRRAEELGGSLRIGAGPGGGTVLRADLPVPT